MSFVRLLRQFTRNYGHRVPPQKTATSIAPRFVNEFNTFYPALVDTVLCNTKYMNNVMEPQEQIKAIAKGYLMKNRRQSEFLLYVYELLEKPENINEKKIYQGYVLASLQEMIQTFFIIENDVLNKAKTRDQKPCWYLLPNANRLGLNDIYLFRSFMNEMIKQNIDQSIFTKIMDLTNEIYLNMETSLHLDFYTIDLNNLTMNVYDRLRMTAGYSKIASIKMALVLCNRATEESFELVEDLCGDLGLMVQINNDFTDYLNYKNSVIRKSGTHIKKRLCTWPLVAALQHFNTEQRGIFEENYGKWDNESEKRIIKLYDDINLEKLYLKEKESRYKRYLSKVCQNCQAMPFLQHMSSDKYYISKKVSLMISQDMVIAKFAFRSYICLFC